MQDTDATAGVVDRVAFGADITLDNTAFSRSGNDLHVAIRDSSDKLIVKDWYSGTSYQVEEFRYVDGTVVTNSQVAGLVAAMASFGGVSTLATGGWVRDAAWRGYDDLVLPGSL